MTSTKKKVEINGVHYNVSDQGESNRAVILLHGMPDTSNVWKKQVSPLLNAGYRVIAPDMLGYGETDKPREVERYSAEHIIGDMLKLIETLDAAPLDIIGHDWGSFVSWELVNLRPDLFRRHVTFQVGHPGALFSNLSPEVVKANWYMYLNTEDQAAELYGLNDCQFWRDIIIPTHPEPDEVCERLKDPEAMQGNLNWDRANQVATFYLALLKGEISYGKCQVPTMGIMSGGDEYLWEEQMKKSEDFMEAEWRYEYLEEGSHWIMLDNPDGVNRLLLDWLDSGHA